MATCSKCNQASEILRTLKCVMCFKLICEGCAVRRYANAFCSDQCASSFFFGTGEEYGDD
jgi:hypothetical protein